MGDMEEIAFLQYYWLDKAFKGYRWELLIGSLLGYFPKQVAKTERGKVIMKLTLSRVEIGEFYTSLHVPNPTFLKPVYKKL